MKRKIENGLKNKQPNKKTVVAQSNAPVVLGRNCPYMDTIERKALDFDFEKVCSVCLSKQNVYACLVCGIFLSGRSKNSHAYFHSINVDHHLFIHMESCIVYCLPDGYRVKDPSIEDIKQVLNPTYSRSDIQTIVSTETYSVSLDGNTYIPGRIGINNLGHTDHVNSVLQCLFSIPPLIKYFLQWEIDYNEMNRNTRKHRKYKLVKSFGELARKFFNPKNFKGQISPQEFLQIVDEVSAGKFKIGKPADPIDFLAWLLNELHRSLRNRNGHSIITETFRGMLSVDKTENVPKEKLLELKPFLYLSLDLPPTPLYRGEEVEKFIPQVPITDILQKFGGGSQCLSKKGNKHFIETFPQYLILHIKRFIKNDFRPERNPTIINFPIKNLELKQLWKEYDLDNSGIDVVKEIAKRRGVCNDTGRSEDIARAIRCESAKYNLVGNIVREGRDCGGTRAFVLHSANGKWYETQDLSIEETMAQLVSVSESYIQIWELERKE